MKVALAGTESLTNYIAALKANDIEVINTLDVEEALKCDGLLLPGGGDIDPKYYGEEMNGSEEPDRELDKAQWDVLDAFVKEKKPVLGICRGMQLINVYFGGSLYQDLKTKDAHSRKNGVDSVHSVKSIVEDKFHPERMSYEQRRDDTVVGEGVFEYFKSLLKG